MIHDLDSELRSKMEIWRARKAAAERKRREVEDAWKGFLLIVVVILFGLALAAL